MERRELLIKWSPGGKLEFDVKNKTDVVLLARLLRELGLEPSRFTTTSNDVVVEYDERFMNYSLKDRGIYTRTARDYMNYLKRLNGRRLDYDLYLEISENKWMVKTVRLYIDFLVKSDKLSEDKAERLLKIFKVKNQGRSVQPLAIDSGRLVEVIAKVRGDSPYRVLLKLLYFSGVRLSEAVKMIEEFDESRLTCRDNSGFCRYYMGWRRGRKRCEFIYFPVELLESIKSLRGSIGKYESIRDTLFDHYRVRPKEYRKLFYRVCRELEVPKEICNFYQSRIKQLDVSDIHYDDLTTRADEYYPRVLEALRERLQNAVGVSKSVQ